VAPLKEPFEKWRREVEDSWNPLGNNISQWFSWPMPIIMPTFLALLFLSFLPCIITSCTCRDINLSKTIQRTAMRAPTRIPQESEDLAPYSAPCQQEAAKRLMLPIPDPQPLSSPLLKKKWGNDRVIMSSFCESASK
jgi:hypothetical protein